MLRKIALKHVETLPSRNGLPRYIGKSLKNHNRTTYFFTKGSVLLFDRKKIALESVNLMKFFAEFIKSLPKAAYIVK